MSDGKEMEKNFEYFEANLEKWLADDLYRHKHVVIADEEVKKVFDDFAKAWLFASQHLTLGEFIIQEVIGEDRQSGFLSLCAACPT